jgi:hypothetical protein
MAILSRKQLVVAFLVCGACATNSNNGDSDGQGAIQGTVHNQSFTIDDAVSAAVTVTDGSTTVHTATILMANAADLCGDAMTNTSHPNEKGVGIILFDVNGTTTNTPTAPGTYTIAQGGTPPAKAAAFQVSSSDATCKDVATESVAAVTGTVTLTAVSGNKFTGSFDVVLDGGDHLTGAFTPSECPALATPSSSAETCR